MKTGLYILAVILFLLGIAGLLEGFGVINLVAQTHHLRYELGGGLVALLGIGLFVYAARRK
ncbi:MAG TPA: hypothetical protein VMC09_06215 [Anaerolineales bacterium]|nr:hypothetical protein [Anaerolineales bacterium]